MSTLAFICSCPAYLVLSAAASAFDTLLLPRQSGMRAGLVSSGACICCWIPRYRAAARIDRRVLLLLRALYTVRDLLQEKGRAARVVWQSRRAATTPTAVLHQQKLGCRPQTHAGTVAVRYLHWWCGYLPPPRAHCGTCMQGKRQGVGGPVSQARVSTCNPLTYRPAAAPAGLLVVITILKAGRAQDIAAGSTFGRALPVYRRLCRWRHLGDVHVNRV